MIKSHYILNRKTMSAILIFILGLKLTDAVIHSYGYIYTATSGIKGFPEFVSVGMVDGQQVSYFDSQTMKMVPRTDWVSRAVDPDFWNRNKQNLIGTHQTFKNYIEVAKQRFNQTEGVHTFQLMYGCEWDDQTEATDAFDQLGYDGKDFLSLDLNELRFISPVEQGFITQQRWNHDSALLEYDKNYYRTICIDWLKKYVEYGKSSLEKTVSPQVSLLQKSSSSPVTCHATGFYPSGVSITWMRNDQEHHEDVEVGELLPNEDGTFQKTSTITVTPDEWKKNKYICVVERQGKTIRKILTEKEIRTNEADSVSIAIIVGATVTTVLLVIIGVAVYMVCQKKKGFKPVSGSEDGSNSSAHTDSHNNKNETRHVGEIKPMKQIMSLCSLLSKLFINKDKNKTGS